MSTPSMVVEFDEAKIDEIFSELNQCHAPGAAVGIAVAGRPVYRKGFGLANIELPVVLSPTVRLRIGSVSKHFTCFAYMLLCERGLAGIDDAVGRFFPEVGVVISTSPIHGLEAQRSR
jgi:D-aminopeptidase